jgi:sulfonate transport system substrate-binding protein
MSSTHRARTLSRRSFLAAAGAAGLAVPLAAACGTSADTTAAPAGTGAAASGERKLVRLTYSASTLAKARPSFEQGLKAQGIDVEWVGPFPNHAPTLQAVVGNTADFSFGGSSTPADQAIISGSPLKYVAWGVTKPRTTAILALPDSGITSVKDLKGKSVAVNKAGLGEFLLVAALEKYKIDKNDVRFVYLNPPEAAPAFAAKQVDAWSIWSGPLEKSEIENEAKAIFIEGDEIDRQIDFTTYLVREDYAEEEADTIRKVILAYKAQTDWANQNKVEAQKIVNEVAKYSQPVVDKIISKNTETAWNFIDDKAISDLQYGADWLAERGVLSEEIDIAEHSVKL